MTALPQLGLYRRVTAAALVLGPLLFLVDNVLHPKEYSRDHELQQLQTIGEHYTRWQVAHAIGLLSAIVLTAALLGLAFHVRRSQPVLGLVGGAAVVIGALGLGAGFALDGFTWGVLGEVHSEGFDAHTLGRSLHAVQQANWSLVYYAPIGVWIAGIVVLAVGMLRSAPPWAAGLLGIGGVAVGVEGLVAENWYFIASSAVLLAGGAALAAIVARMSDAAFAGA